MSHMPVMREINAAELRQSLGQLAHTLDEDSPILLKLAGRPVGVIISMSDFRERFALKAAEAERGQLVEEILADRRPVKQPLEQVLDAVRRR